ncbi:PPX1 [Mytilus edulis]|uniref:PRUNE n=1 Tax=Mytilus edulis TaxID=6550 RepID=A0A8S3TA16_MYTED|nr:PPX1 [Mytilus edulis]
MSTIMKENSSFPKSEPNQNVSYSMEQGENQSTSQTFSMAKPENVSAAFESIKDNATFQLGGLRDGISAQMLQQLTPEQQQMLIAEAVSKAMGSNTENMKDNGNFQLLVSREQSELLLQQAASQISPQYTDAEMVSKASDLKESLSHQQSGDQSGQLHIQLPSPTTGFNLKNDVKSFVDSSSPRKPHENMKGAILIDTVNLSPAAHKMTDQDVAMADKLKEMLPEVNGDVLYNTIQKAKTDISELTTLELLEKDLKIVSGNSVKVAMSSVSISLQDFLSRENLMEDLSSFVQSRSVLAVIVMMIHQVTEGEPVRDIAVYSTEMALQQKVNSLVKQSETGTYQNLVDEFDIFTGTDTTNNAQINNTDVFNELPLDSQNHEQATDEFNEADIMFGSQTLETPHSGMNSASQGPSAHNSEPGSAFASYPITPPNSFIDSTGHAHVKEFVLPSLNSAEMLRKYERKRQVTINLKVA